MNIRDFIDELCHPSWPLWTDGQDSVFSFTSMTGISNGMVWFDMYKTYIDINKGKQLVKLNLLSFFQPFFMDLFWSFPEELHTAPSTKSVMLKELSQTNGYF